MEAIFGTIVGFVAFGIIWFFLLRTKNNEVPTDELKIKDEELKNAQIDLATRDAELKAAVDARKDLDEQLNDKKVEVSNLYKKVDGIVEGVGEYKSISEKAINKHDLFGTRIKNWFEMLTTNVTYQGKFNQQIFRLRIALFLYLPMDIAGNTRPFHWSELLQLVSKQLRISFC